MNPQKAVHFGARNRSNLDASRTIFEDRALWTWFHSDRVRIHDPTSKLGFGWMATWVALGSKGLWMSPQIVGFVDDGAPSRSLFVTNIGDS